MGHLQLWMRVSAWSLTTQPGTVDGVLTYFLKAALHILQMSLLVMLLPLYREDVMESDRQLSSGNLMTCEYLRRTSVDIIRLGHPMTSV